MTNIYEYPQEEGLDLIGDVRIEDDSYTYAFAVWDMGDYLCWATDTRPHAEDRDLFDWLVLDYEVGLEVTKRRESVLLEMACWSEQFDWRYVPRFDLNFARSAIANWRPRSDSYPRGSLDCE